MSMAIFGKHKILLLNPHFERFTPPSLGSTPTYVLANAKPGMVGIMPHFSLANKSKAQNILLH